MPGWSESSCQPTWLQNKEHFFLPAFVTDAWATPFGPYKTHSHILLFPVHTQSHFLPSNKTSGILTLWNYCTWVVQFLNPWTRLREGWGLWVMLCFGSVGSLLLPSGYSVVAKGTASEQAGCKDRGRKAPNQINAKIKKSYTLLLSQSSPRIKMLRAAPMCQARIPISPPANPCHGKAISVLLHSEALLPLVSHPHTSQDCGSQAHGCSRNRYKSKKPFKWAVEYPKHPVFFSDLYNEAYSCLNLFIRQAGNTRQDADNAGTGTRETTCATLPVTKISFTSASYSQASGGNPATLPCQPFHKAAATTRLCFQQLRSSRQAAGIPTALLFPQAPKLHILTHWVTRRVFPPRFQGRQG